MVRDNRDQMNRDLLLRIQIMLLKSLICPEKLEQSEFCVLVNIQVDQTTGEVSLSNGTSIGHVGKSHGGF